MSKPKRPSLAAALVPFRQLSDELDARPPASPKAVLDAVVAAEGALGGLAAALRDARTDLEVRNATALDEIEADLRDLAAKRGWRLEGGWPTFQVERGIEVRVEPAAGIVRVAAKALDATDLPGIEAAVADIVPTLVPKRFAPHEFLEQVERAWRALSDRSAQVPVWDLYARLVIDAQPVRFWRDAVHERFVSLSPDQFRARLSAMLEAGATTTRSGLELRLLPPLDPKDALFVHNPAEQRFSYVGRIEFVAGSRL